MLDEVYAYTIGDTTNIGCTAIDNIDGSVVCSFSGTVDTSVVGSYDVTFTASDTAGNVATLEVTYTVSEEIDPLTMDLEAYYDDAEGLTSTALLLALRIIVNDGFNGVSYDDARYILDETDADPDVPGNVILVYSRLSVSGVWDYGATWNREHVWPQSLLGTSAGGTNIASDLHNLMAADPDFNSSRGNKYFDNATTTVAYEPPDEVKGDVARILFYMIVMYDYLNLVDELPVVYEMALLATLLEWHEMDPVDDWEENRNDVIFSYQDNRNPFIDYPHFVEMIFGDHSYYDE
ncbi:MAG: endonuclease [Tenericutes bacterium]|nr:endonuclease [Mycoplasmatota bacterium]